LGRLLRRRAPGFEQHLPHLRSDQRGRNRLHDWLTAAAVKREHFEGVAEDSKTLLPEFRNAILEGWRPEDPECDETIRGEEYWNIGLGREGMIFSPSIPHAAQVCWEQITVPSRACGPSSRRRCRKRAGAAKRIISRRE
jgi:hypothetical protein